MKKLFTILTALLFFFTGFAQVNAYAKFPLYVTNFWNNNEFWVEPNTLIDGITAQANYVPGYPGQAKTLPDTLVYEFPEAMHAFPKMVRFYDSTGSNNITKIVFTRKSDNKDTIVGQQQHTTGFGQWDQDVNLAVPFECSRIMLIGMGDASYGTEMEIWGQYTTYTEPGLIAPTTFYPIKNLIGFNVQPYQITTVQDSRIMDQTFRGFSTKFNKRIWGDVENWCKTSGDSTYFNGRQWDTILKYLNLDPMFYWVVMNHFPDDINSLWTQYSDHDFKLDLRFQNTPASNPWSFSSYSRYARIAWQLAKRFGFSSTNSSLQRRWQGVFNPDAAEVAAGYLRYIETANERDKAWKDSFFHTSGSMAFYQDVELYNGNFGADGTDVGILNADPSMKIILPGLSFCANLHWIKHYRATAKKFPAWVNPDGSVKWPFHVFSIHYYPSDAIMQFTGNKGAAPGPSMLPSILAMYQDFIARNMPGMELWVPEYGWDRNQNSKQRAEAISPYSASQVRAYWSAQAVFIYAMNGVARATQYNAENDQTPSNSTTYVTAGLINTDTVTHLVLSRDLAGDVLTQIGNLAGDFIYDSTLSASSPTVIRLKQKDTASHKIYVAWNQSNSTSNISAGFYIPLPLNTNYKIGTFDESGNKDFMTLTSGTVSSGLGLGINVDSKTMFYDVTTAPIGPSGPGRIIKQILSLKHN
jgi:hypothetical protein